MKNLSLITVSLLIVSMMMVGCKKEKGADNSNDTPTPTTNTAKIAYKVDNTYEQMVADTCFKYNITYWTSPTDSFFVENVTLPWTSPEITVTKPFKAHVMGIVHYNENSLPAGQFYFGQKAIILEDGEEGMVSGGMESFSSATDFKNTIPNRPDLLKFSLQCTLLED